MINKKYKNTGLPEIFNCLRGMFRRSSHASRGTGGSSAHKRLRGDADDNSDVLLPLHGSIPRFQSMVPAPELKFLDRYTDAQQLSVDTSMAGGILPPSGPLSVPSRGNGPTQFNGRGILIKNWSVRGSFDLEYALVLPTPISGRLAFIALVLDTQTNGTQCVSEDIFTNPGNAVTSSCTPLVNLYNSNRFVVLARKTFELNPKTLTNDYEPAVPPTFQMSGVRVPFEFFVPLDIRVMFKSFTGAISDVVDNSLHVVMFSSYYDTNPLVHQPLSAGGYASRIRFYDQF